MLFIIQGINHSPHEMNLAIETFLGVFNETLNNMTKEEFTNAKSAVMYEMLAPIKTLQE